MTTLSPSTTDYIVVTSTGVPYDTQWGYRVPYCAPMGAVVAKITSSVVGSIITMEGFVWKGWTP